MKRRTVSGFLKNGRPEPAKNNVNVQELDSYNVNADE